MRERTPAGCRGQRAVLGSAGIDRSTSRLRRRSPSSATSAKPPGIRSLPRVARHPQPPLFALAFALVIVGVVIGGIATWLKQSHWRRAARTLDAETRKLRADNDLLRRRVDMAEAALVARADQPSVN